MHNELLRNKLLSEWPAGAAYRIGRGLCTLRFRALSVSSDRPLSLSTQVLFPVREADVDLRLQLRSQTQKTTHKDDFHNHLSVPCVPTALASSLPLKAVRGGRGEAFSLAAELNTPERWARAGEVVKEIEKAEEKNSGATCSPTSTTQGAPNT